MRISFFAPCASAGLPSPARAVATTVPARNSRREDPDLLCLLMIDLPCALLLELQNRCLDCPGLVRLNLAQTSWQSQFRQRWAPEVRLPRGDNLSRDQVQGTRKIELTRPRRAWHPCLVRVKTVLAALKWDFRYSPETGPRSMWSACPFGAMCGRLRIGKDFLHAAGLVGAAMCSAFKCGSYDRW